MIRLDMLYKTLEADFWFSNLGGDGWPKFENSFLWLNFFIFGSKELNIVSIYSSWHALQDLGSGFLIFKFGGVRAPQSWKFIFFYYFH